MLLLSGVKRLDTTGHEIDTDAWRIRDTFCAYFGWDDDSEESGRFIEAPALKDWDRLLEHLGFQQLDPQHRSHYDLLERHLGAPGHHLLRDGHVAKRATSPMRRVCGRFRRLARSIYQTLRS